MSGHSIGLSQFLTILLCIEDLTSKRRQKGVKITFFQNAEIFSEIYTKNAIIFQNISP